MRSYRVIVLILLILLLSIISVVFDWRFVAALGFIFIFFIGLLFGMLYFVPKFTNPNKYWSMALSGSLYIGVLFVFISFLFTLIDPKFTGIKSQLIASGKAGLLSALASFCIGILGRVFPGIISASKEINDKLIRILFRKA